MLFYTSLDLEEGDSITIKPIENLPILSFLKYFLNFFAWAQGKPTDF